MSDLPDEADFRKRMGRLESLLEEIEHLPDPSTRGRIREIVQTILDLHSIGLERVLTHLAETGEAGQAMIDSLAQDELVSSLLLLYGLHPLDIETRVRQAVEKVQPFLRSQGSSAELLSLDGGAVRVRLLESSHGCSSSAATLKSAIEEAIIARAPEVTAIEVEGLTTDGKPVDNGHARIALPLLHG